jgi:tetratricopeptide (TPR) repeat protein
LALASSLGRRRKREDSLPRGNSQGETLERWNLSDRQLFTFAIRICLALSLLFCIYLVGRRGIADWYFRQESPTSVEAAIQWERDNPQYYDALGTLTHFYGTPKNLDASVAFYESAKRLSPYDAHFWSDLGSAYDWAGRANDALSAFKRALRLFPNSPEINWRFANFAFRTHRIPEALDALQVVLVGNIPAHRDVFRLAVSATRDNRAILQMLPPQASVFFDYLNFEMEAGNVTTAEQVWLRLLQLKLPFDLRQAFPYLDALIQHREPGRLVAAWSALAERFPAQIGPLVNNSNLVANGGFEHDILDGGFDWRIVPVDGAVVSMDFQDAFEGARALRIEFNGKRNLDYAHVLQYVAVQPNTPYRFSGTLQMKGISTDSGPRFQVFDAFDMRKLFVSTENTVGTSGWSSQHLEFKTSADTRLLIVRVARPPSQKLDNQISGTVWVDRVSLTPAN